MRTISKLICYVLTAALFALGLCGCSPQAKKARYLSRADAFFDSGQYDRAEIEYKNVLQVEPQNPQAIGRLAIIYFDQGRFGRVIPYLLKGRELQPNNFDLRFRLGSILLSTGDRIQAREEAGYILDHNPQDVEAPLLLAETTNTPDEAAAARQRLLNLPAPSRNGAPVQVGLGTLEFRQRNYKEASADFQRALALEPKSSSALAGMGFVYRAQNDLAKAEAAFKQAAELAPIRSSRRLLFARFKIQTGDLGAGRLALNEITAQAPDFLSAVILQAEVSAAEKKYADSTTLIDKVLALDPAHPEASLVKGRLMLAMGEPAKAVAAMERMLKFYPRSVQALFQLALAHYASGETSEAMSNLNQAISLAPGFAEAIILRAELNLRNGDAKAVIAALRPLTQQRPEMARAKFLLADAYRSQGELDQAISIYRQLETQLPGDSQPPHWKGTVLLKQGKRDEARLAFNKALELAPNNLLTVDQLVGLDLSEKNFAAARELVERQIARDPNLVGPYLMLARVFLSQQDYTQAEAALRKAIEHQPESPVAYLMLARLFASTNQVDKALANFQAVVAKNPKNAEALMMIGTISDQRKNFPAAKEAYEKLLTFNPNFSPALNNLAYLYSEHLNEPDKAQKMAQKARELLPSEPHTADTLGWILYKRHEFPWALSLLLESAAKLPDSAEVQFHLGMTYYMMGEEEPARRVLMHALEIDKDFPGSVEARQCLSVLAMDSKTTGGTAQAGLEKLTDERPDDPVARIRLAGIYARQGQLDKARTAYEAALRASPKNVAAVLGLARLLAANAEIPKAFELAKTAHQQAPDDPEVTQLLGSLAHKKGDDSWAYSLLQDAARKLPENPEVLHDLAEAAYGVGRVSEAEAAMRDALKADPRYSRADDARRFLEMTGVAANGDRSGPAESNVVQALKANPSSVPALIAMAAICERRADAKTAIQMYEKALAIAPEFTPAMKRLAILWSETPANAPKALELVIKARTAYPDDTELARAMGLILYQQADYGRASKLLGECARKLPTDATLMFYFGMAEYKLKNATEGRPALERALSLGLRADLAAQAQQTLAGTR